LGQILAFQFNIAGVGAVNRVCNSGGLFGLLNSGILAGDTGGDDLTAVLSECNGKGTLFTS
jgi:hypothetical protein